METIFQLLSVKTDMAKRMVILNFSLDLDEDTVPDNVYIMRTKPRAIVPCNVEVDGRTINLVFSESWPEIGTEYSVVVDTGNIKSITGDSLSKLFPINFKFETEITSIVKINYPSNFSEVKSPFVVHWEEDSDHNDFSKSFYFELATENYFANLVSKGTIDKLVEDPDQKQEIEKIKAKENKSSDNSNSENASSASDSDNSSSDTEASNTENNNSDFGDSNDNNALDDSTTQKSDSAKELYFKATLPDVTKPGQYFLRIRPQNEKYYGEWSNIISVIVPEGKAEVPNPQSDGGNKRPSSAPDIVDYVAEEEKQKEADDQTKATPTTEVTTPSWVGINDDTPTSFEIAFKDAVNIDNATVKIERRTI